MLMMVAWTLLALATAATVLVVASVAGAEGADRPLGIRSYLADLRAGLRSWRAGHGPEASPRAAAEPVETSIDDFFTATTEHAPAYLGIDDLTGTLARARGRAARGVSGLTRR